jgi:hypothetical protein
MSKNVIFDDAIQQTAGQVRSIVFEDGENKPLSNIMFTRTLGLIPAGVSDDGEEVMNAVWVRKVGDKIVSNDGLTEFNKSDVSEYATAAVLHGTESESERIRIVQRYDNFDVAQRHSVDLFGEVQRISRRAAARRNDVNETSKTLIAILESGENIEVPVNSYPEDKLGGFQLLWKNISTSLDKVRASKQRLIDRVIPAEGWSEVALVQKETTRGNHIVEVAVKFVNEHLGESFVRVGQLPQSANFLEHVDGNRDDYLASLSVTIIAPRVGEYSGVNLRSRANQNLNPYIKLRIRKA